MTKTVVSTEIKTMTNSSAKILAFAGSTRTESFNKKLVRIAADGARAAGAEVTLVDLRDFPMPLYDGDLEAKDSLPAKAIEFKKLLSAHNGLLIACPEYNGGLTAVLKNTLDWASRDSDKDAPQRCFDGKTAAIMSASPGSLGGMRGLNMMVSLMDNFKILVLPQHLTISKAHEAFASDGSLKDNKLHASAIKLGADLANILCKLQ